MLYSIGMEAPYVIANWKMRLSLNESQALAAALHTGVPAENGTVVVCPSFPCLTSVAAALTEMSVMLGAQDVSPDELGPFTSEVAASVLAEVGCRFVIVGHSDRRARQGETDKQVEQKLSAALRHGLTPVLCVGETATERKRGETVNVIKRQLGAVPAGKEGRIIVTYEPVWAISPQPPATGDEAAAMLSVINETLKGTAAAIIYGGSVSLQNVTDFVAPKKFAGVLVGADSLKAAEFLAIIAATRRAFAFV